MDKDSRRIIQNHKAELSENSFLKRIFPWMRESNIFTISMLNDLYNPSCEIDFCDELCTRGPHAFSSFLDILKKSGYEELAEKLEEAVRMQKSFPSYYKMDSEPVGYCLIIVNEIFEDSKKNRMGSKKDANNLEGLFNELQYHVTVEWNKTGEEISSILVKFSQKPEFKNVDSCVVYILTHGGRNQNRDFVYGIDEKKVYLEDIYNIFNNEKCPALIGKPKMFFFQNCRGCLEDSGVKIKAQAGEEYSFEGRKCESLTSTDASGFSHESFSSSKNQHWHPIISDMIVIHSTLPNYKSRKNHLTGSWLCDDLVRVVKNNFQKLDLQEMLDLVNCCMQERVSEDETKQAVHVELFGVTSRVHFNRKNITLEN